MNPSITPHLYTIPITPIPWARPGKTPNGQSYDTQRHEKDDYRVVVGPQWMKATQSTVAIGPLHLDATFFVRIGPSTNHKEDSWALTRPDLDNYVKFLLDALNFLYKDDSQIVSMYVRKIYHLNPRTEFTLVEAT